MKVINAWIQLIFSGILTIWTAFMLTRCILNGSDCFYWIGFGSMLVIVYRMMWCASIKEIRRLKEERQA